MAILEQVLKPLHSIHFSKAPEHLETVIYTPESQQAPTINSATMTDLQVVTVKNVRTGDLKVAAEALKVIEKTPIDRMAIARALHRGHGYPMATTQGSEVFQNLDPQMTGGSTYGEHAFMTFEVRHQEQQALQLPETTQASNFSKALQMNDKWHLGITPPTIKEEIAVDMMVVLEEEKADLPEPVSITNYLESRPGHQITPAPFFISDLEKKPA